MTDRNVFGFFDKTKREDPKRNQKAAFVEEKVRVLACCGAALGYLEQLEEYRFGRHAVEAGREFLQEVTRELEEVQGMDEEAFLAWLEEGER